MADFRVILRGKVCPECGRNNKFRTINIDSTKFNGCLCECGTLYTNLKSLNNSKLKDEYAILSNISRDDYEKEYQKIVSRRKRKKALKKTATMQSQPHTKKCMLCGGKEYFDTGYCYECYKFQKELN